MTRRAFSSYLVCLLFLHGNFSPAAERFYIATYNLENYIQTTTDSRPAKSFAARTKIHEILHSLHAEVLALQEIGSPADFTCLREGLKSVGLDYPYWELVGASDTNIHMGILSQFPITAHRPHTKDTFVLFGRQFQVSRGFAEVDIQVNSNYCFTLISAHLKSRRSIWEADEADFRQQEALVLRSIIDQRLKTNPELNLLVLGDFNDLKSSPPIRTLIGRGRSALLDTRPAERNGDQPPKDIPRLAHRNVTWTYYYAKDDSYTRVDYIFVSRGMAREWLPEETYVASVADWGLASDHRPVVAGFRTEEQK